MNHRDFRAEVGPAIVTVAARFLTQNRLLPLPDSDLAAWVTELEAIGTALGCGAAAAGELPEPVVKAGVGRLLAVLSAPRPELAGLAKQLIKGCHQPDYPRCRESYHETDASGRCRRQELDYDRSRVSGAHCVDCPYWREWPPEAHAARLAAEWSGGADAFHANQAVFLPEDFRALRLLAWPRG
jgi:hypothetical protein